MDLYRTLHGNVPYLFSVQMKLMGNIWGEMALSVIACSSGSRILYAPFRFEACNY